MNNCFLCNKALDTRVTVWRNMQLIAALGPLVPLHALIATTRHCKSFTDIALETPEQIAEIVELRAHLEEKLGPMLITEHGRVPVCLNDDDAHEQHCFHAHFALFPGAVDISQLAAAYFRERQEHGSLEEAIFAARQAKDYLIISPSRAKTHLFSGGLNVPRQLSRKLVAFQQGNLAASDWREFPEYELTEKNRLQLLTALGDKHG